MCIQKKRVLKEKEKVIITKWKVQWEQDSFLDVNSNGEYFLQWLEANMDFLESRSRTNKWKNFLMKFIVLMGVVLAYGIVFYLGYKKDSVSLIIGSTALFVPSFVLYKWINVRKYQETWSRFSTFHSKILQEMVKYLYHIAPYNQGDVKKQFVKSVIELTEQNVEKFRQNMEEKEEKLLSELRIGEVGEA